MFGVPEGLRKCERRAMFPLEERPKTTEADPSMEWIILRKTHIEYLILNFFLLLHNCPSPFSLSVEICYLKQWSCVNGDLGNRVHTWEVVRRGDRSHKSWDGQTKICVEARRTSSAWEGTGKSHPSTSLPYSQETWEMGEACWIPYIYMKGELSSFFLIKRSQDSRELGDPGYINKSLQSEVR